MEPLNLEAIREHSKAGTDLVARYYSAQTKDQEPRGYEIRVTITRLADDTDSLVAEVERLRQAQTEGVAKLIAKGRTARSNNPMVTVRELRPIYLTEVLAEALEALSSAPPTSDVQEIGPEFDTSLEPVKELDGSSSTTQREWEYGIEFSPGWNRSLRLVEHAVSADAATEQITEKRPWASALFDPMIMRRTPAGPWVPAPTDKES
jgi:hypothetical protein